MLGYDQARVKQARTRPGLDVRGERDMTNIGMAQGGGAPCNSAFVR